MQRQRVLFVCIHNSARSQMAEALLNRLAGERFEAESAGLEPGTINPLAIASMKEIGIDISAKKTRSVFDLYKQGRIYHYVISVCDEASERCPVFPSTLDRLGWSFPDPSQLEGSLDERLVATRLIRQEIAATIAKWVAGLQTESTARKERAVGS